jgi:hypothetical protein
MSRPASSTLNAAFKPAMKNPLRASTMPLLAPNAAISEEPESPWLHRQSRQHQRLLRSNCGRCRSASSAPGCGRRPTNLPPLPQRRSPGAVAGHHREVAGHLLQVVLGIAEQCLEQVLLAGEVQVERAARDPGPLDHVIDACPVESALLEPGKASVQQLADGLQALRAQLPVLGGATAAERRWFLELLRWGKPRCAATIAGGSSCAQAATMLACDST